MYQSLNQLAFSVLQNAIAKGFVNATPLEDMALIHSEVSEAVEDIRKGHEPRKLYYMVKKQDAEFPFRCYDEVCKAFHQADGTFAKPCGVPSEMADIIIRVLHFCGKHNIDIEEAIRTKMQYNETRPFMHGKKI